MQADFMERYYQTYNSENPESLAAFYAVDVRMVSAQGEETGRDAIIATYRFIIERFIDRMTPTRILVSGNHAAVEITDEFEARQDVADFLGASFHKGDRFTLQLCAVYEVRDDLIRSVTIYQR